MRKQKYLDLLERTGWTAVQAFAGVLLGSYATMGVDWATVFVSAGIAAGIAAIKCLIAFRFGDPDTATFDVLKPEPPEPEPVAAQPRRSRRRS